MGFRFCCGDHSDCSLTAVVDLSLRLGLVVVLTFVVVVVSL